MLDTLPYVTALVGLAASIIVGLVKMASDKVDGWPALAKQGLVLVVSVALIVVLHFFDGGLIPEQFRGATATILESIIAALAGIGMHNVKDGVIDNTPGAGSKS